jgi:ABC transporter DrrB family efflux protein
MATMDANFRSGVHIGTQTNAMLAKSVQSIGNSLGYPISPIEVVNAQSKEPVGTGNGLYLLSLSDRQQSIFQQMAAYQGLQGSNSMILASLQDVYSECKAIDATSEMDRGAVRVSYNLIDAASGKVEQLGAEVQSMAANPNPIVLNQIQPYGNGLRGLDYLLPNILSLIAFQGAAMGLGRAVAGERKDGSLTRVFLTPTSSITIILGTLLYYVLQETFRTMLIVLAAIAFFGLIVRGSLLAILFIIMLFALGATGVGMVISVITKSQEQYMAVSMLVTLPMMFLAGVFAPIEMMPPVLRSLTGILPITYAADALRGVMIKGFTLGQVAPDLTFLAGFGLITITLSLLLFKRELI